MWAPEAPLFLRGIHPERRPEFISQLHMTVIDCCKLCSAARNKRGIPRVALTAPGTEDLRREVDVYSTSVSGSMLKYFFRSAPSFLHTYTADRCAAVIF